MIKCFVSLLAMVDSALYLNVGPSHVDGSKVSKQFFLVRA